MNNLFDPYVNGLRFTGDLKQDVHHFFVQNDDLRTWAHTLEVVAEVKRIAALFGIESTKVTQAALLHDISNVIPVSAMLQTAEALSIEVLEDERKYDRSVHQKLSMYMAKDIFGMADDEVLAAIESHTTHRANASWTAKLLFAADKLSWRLPGEHPHLTEMRNKVDALDIDGAVLIYLNHIWEQREKLKLVHPWLVEARDELLAGNR